MNKRIRDNIEVAVRARPLNTHESRVGEESAWDIKRVAMANKRVLGKQKTEVKRIIQLKNTFRFGLKEANPEKKCARSVSRVGMRNRSRSAGGLNRCASQANHNNFEPGWKFKSGSISNQAKSVYRQISSYKNGNAGFQQFKTPLYTPTPVRNQHTPESNQNVSEFNINPGFILNRNKRNLITSRSQTRTKSLTAIQSNSTFSRVPRMGAGFSSKTLTGVKNERSSRSMYPFQTTKKTAMVPTPQLNANIHLQQHKFDFDQMYGHQDTNRTVYEQTVRKVALASLEGINGTVFVYGQTGTGKTYTMMGHQRTQVDDEIEHGATVKKQIVTDCNGQQVSARTRHLYETYENSGVLIFAMQDLFNKINDIELASRNSNKAVKFQIKLSYIEIYNEVIYDLLVRKQQEIAEKVLTIQEKKNREFQVNGANQVEVESIQQVLELIKIGEINRHYAETFLNHCSSRSHTMFRLHITSTTQNGQMHLQTSSYLNFVDLAGSEKITNYYGGNVAASKELSHNNRLKESLSINKSLFNLTQVIHMLSQRPNQHIPYRNSTLTKILRSSLGGNSRTSVIICITTANSQIEQTISSLKFGQKAMKVQQSAKVQMDEMKFNALRNRQMKGFKGGANDQMLKEIVEEYEAKIKSLEDELNNNQEMKSLKIQVFELQTERDRLIHALELNCDRGFLVKQMNMKQKQGHTTMTLKHAGDIHIQDSSLAIMNVEQMLLEKSQTDLEQDLVAKSCKHTVDVVQQELKKVKFQNDDLKFECERLENSYSEIIEEFNKMQQLQNEIMQYSKPQNQSIDLTNIDKLTDREIQKLDYDFINKIAKVKEEKAKRSRRQASETHNSSGHLKNFMRPYNPGAYNSSKKSNSNGCLTGRSRVSSPGLQNQNVQNVPNSLNTTRDPLFDKQQELHPDQYHSKQGISDELILLNKNLNSTFGMKKQGVKKSIVAGAQNSSAVKIKEVVNTVHIDRSLYAQEDNYRPGSKRQTSRSSNEQQTTGRQISEKEPTQPFREINLNNINQQNRAQTTDRLKEEGPGPINNFNQYLQQIDVIKEENENIISSFDHSHSHGFDLSSAPNIQYNGVPSMYSGNQIHNVNSGSSQNSTFQNNKQDYIIANNGQHFDQAKLSVTPLKQKMMMETPVREVLMVQPMNQEIVMHDLHQNCNTFDKSIGKLSAIEEQTNNKSLGEAQNKAQLNSIADMMNEELLMEYQLEQMLAQQININTEAQTYSITNPGKFKVNELRRKSTKSGERERSPVFSNQGNHEIAQWPSQTGALPTHVRGRVDLKDFVSFQHTDSTFKNRKDAQQAVLPVQIANKQVMPPQMIKQVLCEVLHQSQPTNNPEEQYMKHADMPCQMVGASYCNSSSNMSGATVNNRVKSSRTKNVSIDLSSTIRSPAQQHKNLEIQEQISVEIFEETKLLDSRRNAEKADNSKRDKDQNYLQIITCSENNYRPVQKLDESNEGCSTPYGAIDTTKSEVSNVSNINSVAHPQQIYEHLIQDNLVNLCIRTNTPTNDHNDVGVKHFNFNNERNQEFQTGMFQKQEEYTMSKKQQEQYKENLVQPQIVYQSSSSGVSQTNSKSQNVRESATGSFKPQMTKEIKQLERTNKKLKKHNEQYKRFMDEILLRQEQEQQMQQICQEEQLIQDNYNKPFNTKDSSRSICSGSTQGLTTVRQSLQQPQHQKSKQEQNHYRLSQDFDSQSKSVKSSKNSKVLRKKKNKVSINTNPREGSSTRSGNSPMAVQMLNKRLNQMGPEPNWQKKSQASFNKMQQLQLDYEQIQKRRIQIMQNLGEPMEENMILRENKMQSKHYEPLERKSSPTIRFHPHEAHLRNMSGNTPPMNKKQAFARQREDSWIS